MKKYILILFLIVLLMPSCKKQTDNPVSGTVTINNILKMDPKTQDYYSMGFLFSAGKIVSSHDTPPPDINIINDGSPGNLILEANNLENSFYKVGQYPGAASAKNIFDALTAPVVTQWVVWADSIKPDQVWLYKSGNEHYTKIRIISASSDFSNSKNYSECTFEWVYQPDGSLTFPGK
jgi:hypothetical protein